MRWPTTRAMMSFGPPGGNGTTSRMVLVGKSCARPKVGHSSANPISSGLKTFTAILPNAKSSSGACRHGRLDGPRYCPPYVIAARRRQSG